MPTYPPSMFELEGVTYEFMEVARIGPVEDVRSWPLDGRPKVHAQIPLKTGGTIAVYAHATHWSKTQISVQWYDDDKISLATWLPKESVRPVTESEWDIDEYNRCPEMLRVIQWGKRMPGILPE